MTTSKSMKRAVRAYMAEHDINYTRALRILQAERDARIAAQERQREQEMEMEMERGWVAASAPTVDTRTFWPPGFDPDDLVDEPEWD